jgi:hypothetical protein
LTLRECLLSPSFFFPRLTMRSSSFMALLFALVMGSAQSLLSLLWSVIGAAVFAQWTPISEWVGRTDPFSATALIGSPLLSLLEVLCITAVFHAGAALTRTTRKDMGFTFRVACYATAAAAAEIIPGIGSVIAAIWFLVLLLRGLSAVHGIRVPRALWAIALPLMLAGAAVLGLGAVAVFLGIMAGGFLKDFPLIYR